MAPSDSEKRPIITALATVLAVGLGVVLVYFGFLLARFGFYALGEGEPLIGVASLLLGAALFAAPLVVAGSQVRALARRR
ncbi:MAG TPA: hypothetical protein VFZ64_06890 [Nocardioidaceae bacterium]